jgi:hypothetical protein
MNDTATTEQPTAPAADVDWEWAIVEIFDHRRHVGKAREEEKFGTKLLRIDVPKLGPGPGEITWSSHFYGGSSLFSYTPTDEHTVIEICRAGIHAGDSLPRSRPRPRPAL